MTGYRLLLTTIVVALTAASWSLAQDTRPATRPESGPATQPDRASPSGSDAFARRMEQAHGIEWRMRSGALEYLLS